MLESVKISGACYEAAYHAEEAVKIARRVGRDTSKTAQVKDIRAHLRAALEALEEVE